MVGRLATICVGEHDDSGKGVLTQAIDGLALVGPTASGKTELAEVLARRYPELTPIAVDALSVYDGLEITTATPERQVIDELGYRFVAHVPLDQEYSLGQFLFDLEGELTRIHDENRRPLLVGGTALWIRAVVNGFRPPQGARGLRLWLEARLTDASDDRSAYQLLTQLDPAAAQGVDPRNRRRLIRALEVALASNGSETVAGDRLGTDATPRYEQLGFARPPEVLAQRIEARVRAQLALGWLDEVERALARNPSRTARMAIGVSELGAFLAGETSLDEAIERIIRRTRRLVRRQLGWLRRDARILWVSSIDEGVAEADRLLGRGGTRLGHEHGAHKLAEHAIVDSAQEGSALSVATRGHKTTDQIPRSMTQKEALMGSTFAKFTGAGNDFLIGEAPTGAMPDAESIAALLNRSLGVGADGLILVDLANRDRPVMHLFNQDGSRAEMSGNGLRCLGHYLVLYHGLDPSFVLMTDAGERKYRLVERGEWAWTGETTMGEVTLVEDEDSTFLVDVGNPHRVVVVPTLAELEALDIAAEGARYQALATKTEGINVEWIVRSEDGCVMRVFERGVGPTLACGTGSVASARVARQLGWVQDYAVVENPGGELAVRFVSVPNRVGAIEGVAAPASRDEAWSIGPGEGDDSPEEIWLRGPSLFVAEINPARWLMSS